MNQSALRPEPRPAGESSLLPATTGAHATGAHATAAATTVEDVKTLAPIVLPEAQTVAEDSDPQLDEDLEAWFAAEAYLPRLTLGQTTARTCGDPPAAASRTPFYVELLSFLVLHPHGATNREVATAFSLRTRRVSADLTAVRAWLGENSRSRNLRLSRDRGSRPLRTTGWQPPSDNGLVRLHQSL